MFVQLHQTLRCAYRTSEKTLTTDPLLTHAWAAEVSPPTPLRPSPWLWLAPSGPGRPPYQACIHLPRDGKPFQSSDKLTASSEMQRALPTCCTAAWHHISRPRLSTRRTPDLLGLPRGCGSKILDPAHLCVRDPQARCQEHTHPCARAPSH